MITVKKKQNNVLLIIIIFILTSFISIQATSLKKVSLQLMWLDQFEFAGFYIAKEKGYYKNVGLDVHLKQFTPNTNILETVINNKAQFGISSSSLLIEKSKGKDVLLLGSIFQSSPLVLLALEDSPIKKIEDIKGKRVMITKEEVFYVTLQTMLKSKNIDIEDLELLEHSFNIDDLIDGTTDLLLAYSTNEPYTLEEKGYKSKIFHPKDYGFNFYEDLIFTTNKFQKQNPKIVSDFYSASIKGWKYAFENIEETATLIHKKYNSQNKTIKSLIFEANEMKKLSLIEDVEFGTITKEKLTLIENSYKIMGLIENNLNLDELLLSPTKKPKRKSNLTLEEHYYLQEKKNLTFCVDPNWFPYEAIRNGKHTGMSADLIELIRKKLDFPLTLVTTKHWTESLEFVKSGKCDILPLAKETVQRKKFLNFSRPYFSFPVVVATKTDKPYVPKVESILHHKLGIVKGYSLTKILKDKYPNITIVEVDSVHDGLNKVKTGEIYGLIDSLITIGYEIQNKFLSELKISAQFDMNHPMSIASRKDEPLLHSILQKTLDDIDEKSKQNIINNWISIKVEKGTDYASLWKFFGILTIILVAFTYRHYILTKSKKVLEKKVEMKTKELQVLNDNLEKKVQQRTEELEDSNEVFQHMLHTTMEAIFILEYNYCVDANKEAIELFKYPNNEALIGTFMFDLIIKTSHEYLKSGEDLSKNRPYEIKAVKSDGTVFPALIKIQSLSTKNRIIKILTLLDLTNIKEQELKLINQSKMASLGELIGNIAHQWRQPLASITTAASGMKMQKELEILDDDEFYTNCDDIVQSSNYLSETINEFRHLIKGNKQKKDFKINETIIQSTSLLTGLLSENSIEIINTFDKEVIFNGFNNDLTQVIINILKNSHDAFIEKEILNDRIIFITTKVENNKLLICIKDTARGISNDIVNKIFEPYFTTKHKSQGTGLGLYMVHQIITDCFNGDIEVSSEEYLYDEKTYTGASFTISLPLNK